MKIIKFEDGTFVVRRWFFGFEYLAFWSSLYETTWVAWHSKNLYQNARYDSLKDALKAIECLQKTKARLKVVETINIKKAMEKNYES